MLRSNGSLVTAVKPKSKHGFRAAILLLYYAIEEKEVPHNFVSSSPNLCVRYVVIVDCKDLERTQLGWFLIS
jgi:hypothetical protein